MEFIKSIFAWFGRMIEFFLHLDVHLNDGIQYMGTSIYGVLFLVIFCETGLVVTPFLPGDSLLFALGALCASENAFLSYPLLLGLLIGAGILGDAVNYSIGKRIGEKVFSSNSPWLKKEYLDKTRSFYEKYGGKTIIFARFLPIIRTFAPFVAGVGQMSYPRFAVFNVVGAVLWVGSFLSAGYYFGNMPAVKSNFHYVILAIMVISALPAMFEMYKERHKLFV